MGGLGHPRRPFSLGAPFPPSPLDGCAPRGRGGGPRVSRLAPGGLAAPFFPAARCWPPRLACSLGPRFPFAVFPSRAPRLRARGLPPAGRGCCPFPPAAAWVLAALQGNGGAVFGVVGAWRASPFHPIGAGGYPQPPLGKKTKAPFALRARPTRVSPPPPSARPPSPPRLGRHAPELGRWPPSARAGGPLATEPAGVPPWAGPGGRAGPASTPVMRINFLHVASLGD